MVEEVVAKVATLKRHAIASALNLDFIIDDLIWFCFFFDGAKVRI
jgi:hypothetical protein